jgi:LPXTG-site transpeptidase (sortase) family protein
MNKLKRNLLIILVAALALFVLVDFEYLRFSVLDWFNLNSKLVESLPPATVTPEISMPSAPSTPVVAPTSTPTYIQKPNTVAKKYRPPEMSPFTVEVDSLNIRVPIVYVYGITEKDFQAGLINGVVLYPGTALPGSFGNPYIFGHSSDYIWSNGHYKTIFAPLPKIALGAEIIVTGNKGEKFIYKVISSKKVAANDTSVLSQQGYTKKLITLQTSYPVGTALARWVVVGEMK